MDRVRTEYKQSKSREVLYLRVGVFAVGQHHFRYGLQQLSGDSVRVIAQHSSDKLEETGAAMRWYLKSV